MLFVKLYKIPVCFNAANPVHNFISLFLLCVLSMDWNSLPLPDFVSSPDMDESLQHTVSANTCSQCTHKRPFYEVFSGHGPLRLIREYCFAEPVDSDLSEDSQKVARVLVKMSSGSGSGFYAPPNTPADEDETDTESCYENEIPVEQEEESPIKKKKSKKNPDRPKKEAHPNAQRELNGWQEACREVLKKHNVTKYEDDGITITDNYKKVREYYDAKRKARKDELATAVVASIDVPSVPVPVVVGTESKPTEEWLNHLNADVVVGDVVKS